MTWGLIYVVRNRRLGDTVVKIGKTNRSIEERIRELNAATSNLGNFEPLAFFPVSDIDKAELECHSALSHQREQRNREFFGGDIGTIVRTVETICKRYTPNSFMADDFRNIQEEPRNDKIDGLELRVARLREEEETRKQDVEKQEKRRRALASSLTAATRHALADFRKRNCR